MNEPSPRKAVTEARLDRRGLLTGSLGLAAFAISGRATLGRQSTPNAVTPFGVPIVRLASMPGFDAVHNPGFETAWLSTLVYDSPLQVDGDGMLRAGVVIDSTTSADGLQIDLRLRPDAMFSDGSFVTAGDVAASLERCRASGSELAESGRWERVDRIEVNGEQVVRIRLTQPDITILPTLADPRTPVIPKAWSEREWTGQPGGTPPGSGPFMVSSIDRGQIELRRQPGYWQVGRPRLEGVLVSAGTETVPRTTELVTGMVDFIVDAPLLDVPTLREDPNLSLVGGPSSRLCLLSANLTDGNLRDKQVRSLVSSAIDRDALLDAAVASEGEPASGLFPKASWVQADAESTFLQLSPEDVRAELSALGFLAGLQLRLIADQDDASLANACILLQEQFAYAGIAVTLDLLTTAQLAVTQRDGSWDLLAMYSDFWRDPDELARPLLGSNGRANLGGYRSERVDFLIDEAMTTSVARRRAELYQVVQTIVLDDVPVIPLFFPSYYDVMTSRLRNYEAHPPISGLSMRQVRMGPADQVPPR